MAHFVDLTCVFWPVAPGTAVTVMTTKYGDFSPPQFNADGDRYAAKQPPGDRDVGLAFKAPTSKRGKVLPDRSWRRLYTALARSIRWSGAACAPADSGAPAAKPCSVAGLVELAWHTHRIQRPVQTQATFLCFSCGDRFRVHIADNVSNVAEWIN